MEFEQFEDLLMQSSDVFQRFAVAWEQVVFETLTNASSFQNEFNRTRMQLRQVNIKSGKWKRKNSI